MLGRSRSATSSNGSPSDNPPLSRELQQALRTVPTRPVPPELSTRLRVLASREYQRALPRRSWRTRLEALRLEAWLWTENIMRPLMVPATGGFFSTVLLFFALTPIPAFRSVAAFGDVPLPKPVSEAKLRYIPPIDYQADITVDMQIDSRGRMVSYHIVEGEWALADNSARRQFETALMLMEFNPATEFGQRTSAKIRIVFRNNADVEIRG